MAAAGAADARQGHRWNDHRMVVNGILFRTRPGAAMAGKAYSSAANRAWLRKRGITAVIPVKEDRRRTAAPGDAPAADRPPSTPDGTKSKIPFHDLGTRPSPGRARLLGSGRPVADQPDGGGDEQHGQAEQVAALDPLERPEPAGGLVGHPVHVAVLGDVAHRVDGGLKRVGSDLRGGGRVVALQKLA